MHTATLKADKGKQGGACNRTACQADGTAHCYNTATNAWYCRPCAILINRANPEGQWGTGLPLVTIPDNYRELVRSTPQEIGK